MKLLIAGGGFIVQDWLTLTPRLHNLEMTGIAVTPHNDGTVYDLAKKYNIAHVYTNYDQALAENDCDTVYVAVPNSLHYDFVKKALNAGKNVICEKPFTLNYAQFKELKNLALNKDLVLVEAITNIYLPNFSLMKQQLENIGPVKIVSMNYSQYSHRYDKFKNGIVEPAFDPKKGGGALMDLNIYNIHLLAGLFGMPKHVHYLANIARGVDTSGILTLDYGDFKAVSIAAKDCGAPITSMIEGEKGTLVVNGAPNELPSFDLYHKFEKVAHYEEHHDDHRMYDEFNFFEKIIATHDMDAVKKALDHSEIVMKIVDMAHEK